MNASWSRQNLLSFFSSMSLLNLSICIFNLDSCSARDGQFLNFWSRFWMSSSSLSNTSSRLLYSPINSSIIFFVHSFRFSSHIFLKELSTSFKVGKIWIRRPKGLMSDFIYLSNACVCQNIEDFLSSNFLRCQKIEDNSESVDSFVLNSFW